MIFCRVKRYVPSEILISPFISKTSASGRMCILNSPLPLALITLPIVGSITSCISMLGNTLISMLISNKLDGSLSSLARLSYAIIRRVRKSIVSTFSTSGSTNFTKLAYDTSSLRCSGRKNLELSALVTSISKLVPRLSPLINASPVA